MKVNFNSYCTPAFYGRKVTEKVVRTESDTSCQEDDKTLKSLESKLEVNPGLDRKIKYNSVKQKGNNAYFFNIIEQNNVGNKRKTTVKFENLPDEEYRNAGRIEIITQKFDEKTYHTIQADKENKNEIEKIIEAIEKACPEFPTEKVVKLMDLDKALSRNEDGQPF